ncbi:MAG: hypothetical protein H6625_13795 [Bdellovibrionaceae bacterium]|nr:hypothetical protein [Pseudobdellovibrionaceae bacterium]
MNPFAYAHGGCEASLESHNSQTIYKLARINHFRSSNNNEVAFENWLAAHKSFFSVEVPQSADLRHPFIFVENHQGKTLCNLCEPPYLWPIFNLAVFRGNPNGQWIKQDWFDNLSFSASNEGLRTEAAPSQSIKDSLQQLYARYENAGPERQSILDRVKVQDQNEVDRITHFAIYTSSFEAVANTNFKDSTSIGNAKEIAHPFGHLQVLLSFSSDQKLHIEEEIGEIVREKDEIVAEVGRFGFQFPDTLPQDDRKFNDREFLDYLPILNLQRAFSWLTHDTSISRVYFQVNEGMSRWMARKGIPTQKAKVHKIKKVYMGDSNQNTEVEEYIFELNRQQLKIWNQAIMKTVLIKNLKKFLSQTKNSQPKFEELAQFFMPIGLNKNAKLEPFLTLTFKRNEFTSLVDLGVLKLTTQNNNQLYPWHLQRLKISPEKDIQLYALPLNFHPKTPAQIALDRTTTEEWQDNVFYYFQSYSPIDAFKTEPTLETGPYFVLDSERINEVLYLKLALDRATVVSLLNWLKN